MGHRHNRQLILSIILLITVGLIVQCIPTSIIKPKSVLLRDSLDNIPGWTNSGFHPLGGSIIDILYLDDYINTNFSNGKEIVSLYIGYYFSNQKVGAAHDPMVCFPGQGWQLSDKSIIKLPRTSSYDHSITYSMMTGTLGDQKELIIYWFQAYDTANSSTLAQKISLLFNRIINKGEDNAFIRITIPVTKRSISEYQDIVNSFIHAFYPVFLEYVKKG